MENEISLGDILQKQINKDNKRKEKSLLYMTTINKAIERYNKRHEQELKEIAEIYEQQQKADFCDDKPKKHDERATLTNENTTSRLTTQPIFKSYKELNKEIHKRDYENIKGLKAEISEDEYNFFLNVLPPLKWKDESFILSECLTENLYHKFFIEDNKYFCEIVEENF